jgi:uncharacterized protein YlxW (UPF0749 family)
MRTLLHRLAAWVVRRIGIAALAVVIGLGAYAVWLGRHDPVDFDAHHRTLLAKLSGEQERAQVALAEVQSRVAQLQAERSAQEERRRTADQAIASLRAGDHWWSTAWNKLFGDSAEVRTREERLARLEQARTEAAARIAELRETAAHAIWERDGVEIDLEKVNRSLAAVERDSSKTLHYLSLSWRQSRWYVIAALATWFLGPTAWRLRHRPAGPGGASTAP